MDESVPDPESDLEIRPARREDRDAIVAFTSDTWDTIDDYVPDTFEKWLDTDDSARRTLVATLDDRPVGLCQGVLLSEHEAWAQGMRVDPEVRGREIGSRLTEAVFRWAADRGATVCRNMVFSWNAAGMGQSRALGFEPKGAFRWMYPTPDADTESCPGGESDVTRSSSSDLTVETDPALAWRAFRDSEADRTLRGLSLDLDEQWALAELTPERLETADSVLAVHDGDRLRAMSYRTRTFEREDDEGTNGSDESTRWAEYGTSAWEDVESLRTLAIEIGRDAADAGADRIRVLVPETPRHVSDAAYARIETDSEPDFVFERDLTAYR